MNYSLFYSFEDILLSLFIDTLLNIKLHTHNLCSFIIQLMGNSNCISTSLCDFDCCGYDGWCPTSSNDCYYYYPNAGVIAGAVIGSIAGLAIIIVIACYCYRQRQLQRLRVELERNQSQAIYRHNNSMGNQPMIQMPNGPQPQPIFYNQQAPPYQPMVGQPMMPPYLLGSQPQYLQGMGNQNIYYP